MILWYVMGISLTIEFTSTTQGGETTYEWVATGDAIGLDQTDDGSGLISGFTADNLTSEL